jgi:hypothetical protein
MPVGLFEFKIGDMVEMVDFSGFDVNYKRLGLVGSIWEVTKLSSSVQDLSFYITIRDPFTQRELGPYYATRFIRV